MHILNFSSHPLTAHQSQQLAELLGELQPNLHVHTVSVQLNVTEPLAPQIAALVDQTQAELGWSAEDWQTQQFVVGLPGLAPAAAVLLAELAGRCGYLPTFYRLAARPGAATPVFDVAEVVAAQTVRDAARARRQG